MEKRVAAVEFELLADIGSMILDRARADIQLGGNLFAGSVLSDQSQDASLGGGEIIQAWLMV